MAPFLEIDPACLRASFLSIHVQPPGTIQPLQSVSSVDHELPFICSLREMGFGSNRGLQMHMRKKHQHVSLQSVVYSCVITNQCPICGVILADKLTAQHHVATSIQRECCRPNMNRFHHSLVAPKPLQCPIRLCSQVFQELRHLQTHICLFHLPLTPSHTVLGPNGPMGVEEAHGLR